MILNIAGRFWFGYFLVLGLLLGAGVSHAAIYQMRVIYYVNGYVAGDVYLNASGNTSASLQDALTTTLEQSSLTSFACGTGSANKGLTITGPVASNAQMLVGYWCNFIFPDQASPMRAVYIATIATGQMTENVLTGTVGSGSGGSSADLTALQTLVTELQGQLASVSAANVANSNSVGQINAVLNEPFDLLTALAATGFFFGTVLSFYAISKAAGAILAMIKSPTGRG